LVSSSFVAQSGVAENTEMESARTGPNPWIVSPTIDFFFVCGGIVWLLCGLHLMYAGWHPYEVMYGTIKSPAANAAVSKALIIVSMIGVYFFADTHTAATYMRVYATPESRKQFKLYGTYLPWVSLLLFIGAMCYQPMASCVVYIHLMWVFQHYTSQSYGIALIYCYKRGYMMSKLERDVFKYMLQAVAATVITRILCIRAFSPWDYYGLSMPFWNFPIWMFYVSELALVSLTLVWVGLIVRKYFVEKKLIPLPTVMTVLCVATIGLSIGYANAMLWLWGAAFFHGSQYCIVSLAYHLKERGLPEGMSTWDLSKALLTPAALKWMGMVILAGVFIYVGVPDFFSKFGFNFVVTASVIQACLNFHHFVTDAAIWRLRDPKCREILLA
jgi:hypothetical protein